MCIKYGMSVSEFYECELREVYAFLEERSQAEVDRMQQEWDYARHIMWAAIKPHVEKNIEPWQLIRLKRDGKREELTPWENQQVEEWNKRMDEEMMLEGKTIVSW